MKRIHLANYDIDEAVNEYLKFTEIIARYPGEFVVPSLKADLIWHAHILSGVQYENDCKAFVGSVIQHRDDYSEDKLKQGEKRTAQLYRKIYLQRNTSSASCGSACFHRAHTYDQNAEDISLPGSDDFGTSSCGSSDSGGSCGGCGGGD